MQAAPSVLLYGHDRELLNTRKWILESVGIPSQIAGDLQEFEAALARLPFALAILCHTVNPAEREAAVATTYRLRPGMRILVLVTAATAQQLRALEPTLDTQEGPAKLVQAVQQMMATPYEAAQGNLSQASIPKVVHLPVLPCD